MASTDQSSRLANAAVKALTASSEQPFQWGRLCYHHTVTELSRVCNKKKTLAQTGLTCLQCKSCPLENLVLVRSIRYLEQQTKYQRLVIM